MTERQMNYWTKISLNIAAAFAVAIFASFIPELAPDFFGDWSCKGSKLLKETTLHYYQYEGCQYNNSMTGQHGPTTHWGVRHWLWMLMGLTLFVVQIFRINSIKNPNE